MASDRPFSGNDTRVDKFKARQSTVASDRAFSGNSTKVDKEARQGSAL